MKSLDYEMKMFENPLIVSYVQRFEDINWHLLLITRKIENAIGWTSIWSRLVHESRCINSRGQIVGIDYEGTCN